MEEEQEEEGAEEIACVFSNHLVFASVNGDFLACFSFRIFMYMFRSFTYLLLGVIILIVVVFVFNELPRLPYLFSSPFMPIILSNKLPSVSPSLSPSFQLSLLLIWERSSAWLSLHL